MVSTWGFNPHDQSSSLCRTFLLYIYNDSLYIILIIQSIFICLCLIIMLLFTDPVPEIGWLELEYDMEENGDNCKAKEYIEDDTILLIVLGHNQ